MRHPLVVMGVSGCGKSSLGQALAQALGARFVEGDSHHSPANRAKMRDGIALTDEDRAGWLDALVAQLQAPGGAAVLTCSALKRAYRQRLRTADAGLRFIFLDIARDEALRRVATREDHFFCASLVDNQFATLERPDGEAGVLRLDAAAPPARQQAEALAWLRTQEPLR